MPPPMPPIAPMPCIMRPCWPPIMPKGYLSGLSPMSMRALLRYHRPLKSASITASLPIGTAPTTQSIRDFKKKFSRGVPPHVARRKQCKNECVTPRTHGRMVQAGSVANAQQLAGAFLKPRPGWLDDDRLVIRLFFQRFGTTTFIDLHKLHGTIHPRNQPIRQWCSPECDDDLGMPRCICRPRICTTWPTGTGS